MPKNNQPLLVYATRIREYIAENYDLKTSKEFIVALNKKVEEIVDNGAELAMEDRRKTVKARDVECPAAPVLTPEK